MIALILKVTIGVIVYLGVCALLVELIHNAQER